VTKRARSSASTRASRYVVAFITWHQWQKSACTLSRISFRSRRACAKASALKLRQAGAKGAAGAGAGARAFAWAHAAQASQQIHNNTRAIADRYA